MFYEFDQLYKEDALYLFLPTEKVNFALGNALQIQTLLILMPSNLLSRCSVQILGVFENR